MAEFYDGMHFLSSTPSSFTQALEEVFPLYAKVTQSSITRFMVREIMKTIIALRWSLQPFNINPNRDVVSHKVLPAVIYEFDPTRPYLPSSPYYSQAVYERGSAY